MTAFALDESSGALEKVAELETAPFPIALSASGEVLYVASGGAEPAVQMFFIEPGTGKLRPGERVSGDFAPWSLRAMRLAAGPFLLLVALDDKGAASLSSLALDAGTGRPAARPTSTMMAGVNAADLAVEPTGRVAYVGNFGSNDISSLALEPTTGVVTSLGSVPAGTAPGALAVASAPH